MQSVPITTKVVSLNPAHGEVYPIQHNVIKFVSDLRQVGGFSPGTPISSTNKTDRYGITEILLKVVINTINQTKPTRKIIYVFFLSRFVHCLKQSSANNRVVNVPINGFRLTIFRSFVQYFFTRCVVHNLNVGQKVT